MKKTTALFLSLLLFAASAAAQDARGSLAMPGGCRTDASGVRLTLRNVRLIEERGPSFESYSVAGEVVNESDTDLNNPVSVVVDDKGAPITGKQITSGLQSNSSVPFHVKLRPSEGGPYPGNYRISLAYAPAASCDSAMATFEGREIASGAEPLVTEREAVTERYEQEISALENEVRTFAGKHTTAGDKPSADLHGEQLRLSARVERLCRTRQPKDELTKDEVLPDAFKRRCNAMLHDLEGIGRGTQ